MNTEVFLPKYIGKLVIVQTLRRDRATDRTGHTLDPNSLTKTVGILESYSISPRYVTLNFRGTSSNDVSNMYEIAATHFEIFEVSEYFQ